MAGDAGARFVSFWDQVLSVGQSPSRSARDNAYSRRANLIGVVLFAASFPYGPLLFFRGFDALGSVLFVTTCFYLAPIALHYWGHNVTARMLPTVIAGLNIGAIALQFGREPQAHLALFIFLALPFQVFDIRKEFAPLFVPVALCTALFLAIQLDLLPIVQEQPLTPDLARTLRGAFGVGTMVVFFLTLGYFYGNNLSNEDALQTAIADQEQAIADLERTRASLELARDEARRAGAAKGEFLSMVSHELNTPLFGVLGALDELLSRKPDPRNAEALSLLEQSASRLAYLLRGLVDFVQIDRDGHYFASVPFDLVRTIRESCEAFARQAQDKGLSFELAVQEGPKPWALGDARRVAQVLSSVVENAVRYTASGRVVVEAQLVPVDQKVVCSVVVSDTGPGIPESLRRKVFEAFAQAVDSRHRGADGLGLGLATSRKILSVMGGRLELCPREQGGTRVELEFSLPLAEQARPEALMSRRGSSLAAPPKLPSVLIAEDNSTSRRILSRAMQRLGYEVCSVEDGEQAVRAFMEREFDVLLLDVQMPVMDGLDAARQIRRVEAGRVMGADEGRVPLIFLTANTSPEQEAAAWEIGIEGYLNKPCRTQTLRLLLQSLSLPAGSEPDEAAD